MTHTTRAWQGGADALFTSFSCYSLLGHAVQPCFAAPTLAAFKAAAGVAYQGFQVIAVDEAQFFPGGQARRARARARTHACMRACVGMYGCGVCSVGGAHMQLRWLPGSRGWAVEGDRLPCGALGPPLPFLPCSFLPCLPCPA